MGECLTSAIQVNLAECCCWMTTVIIDPRLAGMIRCCVILSLTLSLFCRRRRRQDILHRSHYDTDYTSERQYLLHRTFRYNISLIKKRSHQLSLRMSLDHSNHTSDVEEGEINDEPVMPVKQVQSPMQVATSSSLNGKYATDNGSKSAAGRFSFSFF